MVELMGPGTPLSVDSITSVLHPTGLGQAELWSVLSVETSGCGYLPDRRPKILFERHVFSRLTGHRFDAQYSDISQPTPGGYGASGAHQYQRLTIALELDAVAALQSASWGLGQIMGEHYRDAGYANVEDMVAAMVASEQCQLQAMLAFVSAQSLIAPLRAHDWCAFAHHYNGPNYAANNYDGLLAQFYAHFAGGSTPDLQVRSAQIYLSYAGFLVAAVDGVPGAATRRAVLAYQAHTGVAQTGVIDAGLLTALSRRA
ncbi:MAG TPA: N-acetylmuramidase domain-containing protein [Steroidobacteraceae bacterium]